MALLVILTQYGAVRPLAVARLVEPPVLLREVNTIPPPGVTQTPASIAPAADDSRIITPAFAFAPVFGMDVTRIVLEQFPLVG